MSKQDAYRWVMEAPDEALPSVDQKSYHAMIVLKAGNGSAGFMEKHVRPKPDTSGISVEHKLACLKAAHEDNSHLGGRDGIVNALRQGNKTWTNCVHDAAWYCRRCVECRKRSCRDLTKPAPRHLPKTGTAGEVIGWDMKTVKSPTSERWIMVCVAHKGSKNDS